VAMNDPNAGRAAFETAVRKHVDSWITQNPTVGNVLKNSSGMIDRMVAGVIDAVMAAKEVVQGPSRTDQTQAIVASMNRAAGLV
jgi:hypothetical protein